MLLLADDRSHLGFPVERIAHPDLAHLVDIGREEFVVDVLVEKQAGAGGAALSGIGEDRKERAIDRFLQIGIREDDIRTLAAQFQGDLLDRPGRRAHDLPAGFRFTGERHLLDQRMRGQHLAQLLAGTGEHIHDPGGNSGFQANLTENQRGQRGGAGWFEYHRISGRQCRCYFPGRHQQGKIPGNDLRADAVRFPQRVIEQRAVHRNLVAPDLTGQIAVVLEAISRGGDVAPRFDDDLAGIHRFQTADLVDSLAQQIGDLVQRAAAIQWREATPWTGFERPVRCLDGGNGIVLAGFWHDADDLVGRGADGFEGRTAGCGDLPAVDDHSWFRKLCGFRAGAHHRAPALS